MAPDFFFFATTATAGLFLFPFNPPVGALLIAAGGSVAVGSKLLSR